MSAEMGGRKIANPTIRNDPRRSADSKPAPLEPYGHRLQQSVARQIDDEISALSSSRADFPFALGHLVARIVGDRAPSADGQIWWNEGRNLVTCLLSHFVCSPHEVKPFKRLQAMQSLLLKPMNVIQGELGRIERQSMSILARVLAIDLLAYGTAGRFEAIHAVALDQTRWLFEGERADFDPAA